MKHDLPLFLFFLIACTLAKGQLPPTQQVNAILGDISYLETYGKYPTLATPEKERISVHLAYVENRLRNKSAAHLPEHLQERRKEMLGYLHEYRIAGEFPVNKAYPGQRRPCLDD